jgi:hypothetical protein
MPETNDAALLTEKTTEAQSPLTPFGQQILSAHPARRQPSEFAALTELTERWAGTPPWLLLVWLAGPFLFVDLAVSPLMELSDNPPFMNAWETVSLVLVLICFGAVAVQATQLYSYVAFSSDPWWQRLAVFFPLAVVYGGAGLVGTWLVYGYRNWNLGALELENSVRFYCAVPLVALAGIVPLIFFRWVFAWSIVRTAEPEGAKVKKAAYKPASLLNMMLLTAAIAGGFGMIRIAPVATLDEPGSLWVVAGVLAVVSGGFSIFGVLPLIVLCHYVRSYALRFLIGIAVLLIGIAAAAAIFVSLTSWNFFLDKVVVTLGIFGGVVLTYFVGWSLHMRLLSACGWTIRPTNYVSRAK